MRKILLTAALLCVAVVIVACGSTGSVQNPITSVDMYRVKLAYAASLQLADDYRTYCWTKTYRQILADPVMKPVCQNRRTVVRGIQKYQPIAGTAVRKADDFVAKNPVIDASSVIQLAWTAVTNFQNILPARSAVPAGG